MRSYFYLFFRYLSQKTLYGMHKQFLFVFVLSWWPSHFLLTRTNVHPCWSVETNAGEIETLWSSDTSVISEHSLQVRTTN